MNKKRKLKTENGMETTQSPGGDRSLGNPSSDARTTLDTLDQLTQSRELSSSLGEAWSLTTPPNCKHNVGNRHLVAHKVTCAAVVLLEQTVKVTQPLRQSL